MALVFQLPWVGFYYSQTGRFSLTESNFGHVLYVSLGSHPNNPWGIDGSDEQAGDAVRKAGYAYSSLSEQGSQILLRLAIQKAKMHPYGIVQRTVRQLKNTLLAPFNWGEPKLNKKGALYLDVLREELKNRLGVGVNVLELADYRSRGLYSDAVRDTAALFALLYQFVTVGLGSAVLFLGMAGMLIMAFQAHTRPAKPLLYLLGCAVVYKILQDVLLAYQVNYLSNVYPMFLPFVSISLITLFKRFRKR